MKKIILPTVLLAMSASVMTAQAVVVEQSFADQLMMQKTQLHPQEFNFFSDRYKQVQAHRSTNVSSVTDINLESPSFKMQLDSQKQQLRAHQFNPISDAYFQKISR